MSATYDVWITSRETLLRKEWITVEASSPEEAKQIALSILDGSSTHEAVERGVEWMEPDEDREAFRRCRQVPIIEVD